MYIYIYLYNGYTCSSSCAECHSRPCPPRATPRLGPASPPCLPFRNRHTDTHKYHPNYTAERETGVLRLYAGNT